MRPTPPPGSSSLDPVHNFTGFKKSAVFCVMREGYDVGLCAPRPHQGGTPWTRFTMGLRLKKSTIFCVKQQERMCCIIPRQRLSVCSGPGQPVDRGFSGCRVWGKTCFPPRTITRKPLLAAGNMAVIPRSPHASRGNTSNIPSPISRIGVQGNHSPARRRPSFSCLEVNTPKPPV